MSNSIFLPATKTNFSDVYEEEREVKSRRTDERMTLDRFLFKAENERFFLMRKDNLKEYELLAPAISQICSTTGYPKRIAEKLPCELVEQSIDHLLKLSTNRFKEHLIRFNGSDSIMAILSEDFKIFDPTDLLDLIVNQLGSSIFQWEIASVDRTLESFHLRIIKRKNRTMKVGTTFADGISLATSSCGMLSTHGELFELILRCQNGMCSMEPQDKFRIPHINTTIKHEEAFKALLTNAEHSWPLLAGNYENALGTLIPDSESFIEKVNTDFSLGKRLSADILEFYKTHKDFGNRGTLQHMSDIYTEYSHTHFKMSDENFHETEKIGVLLLKNYSKYLSVN